VKLTSVHFQRRAGTGLLSTRNAGIYALWGLPDADGFYRAYIGRGNLSSRISSHFGEKRWWSRGVAVIVDDIDWSGDVLKDAEGRACLKMEQASRCLLGNRNLPRGLTGGPGVEVASYLVEALRDDGVDVTFSEPIDSSQVLHVLEMLRRELELDVHCPPSGRARVYQPFQYTDMMSDSALWAYPDRHSSWRGIEFGLGLLGPYRYSFVDRLESFADERVSAAKFPAVPTPWAGHDQAGFRELVLSYFSTMALSQP